MARPNLRLSPSMLICRLKEESKWSQSYYAYLCGGKFKFLSFQMLGVKHFEAAGLVELLAYSGSRAVVNANQVPNVWNAIPVSF